MPRIPERIRQYQNGYSTGYRTAERKTQARIAALESLCEFYKRFLIKAVEDLHDERAQRADKGDGDGR